jgi:hypothetical protein
VNAKEFLAFLDKIPRLLDLARQQDNLRRYQVQDDLRQQCRAEGRPFLYSMPMRHLYTCPVCGRQATDILHELEYPRNGRKIEFLEVVLHQAQAHDIPPEHELAASLEVCLKEIE